MSELTPEEAELYERLYGADAPKPTTHPHGHHILLNGDDREVVREDRPRRGPMQAIPAGERGAVVLCRNGRGRPATLAAIVTNRAHGVGFVVPVTGIEAPRPPLLGEDFGVDCRCGMRHQVDGEALRLAVLALLAAPRHTGRTPTIDVLSVERVP